MVARIPVSPAADGEDPRAAGAAREPLKVPRAWARYGVAGKTARAQGPAATHRKDIAAAHDDLKVIATRPRKPSTPSPLPPDCCSACEGADRPRWDRAGDVACSHADHPRGWLRERGVSQPGAVPSGRAAEVRANCLAHRWVSRPLARAMPSSVASSASRCAHQVLSFARTAWSCSGSSAMSAWTMAPPNVPLGLGMSM